MEFLELAYSIVHCKPLCDNCLGRQFAMLGRGLTNEKRGESLKLLMTAYGHEKASEGDTSGIKMLETVAENGMYEPASQTLTSLKIAFKTNAKVCHICGDSFSRLEEVTDRVVERMKEYEYSSFLVGVILPPEIEEREDELRAEFNVKWAESIRSEFSREIGKRVSTRTGVEVDFGNPDITVLIDPTTTKVDLQISSIYISGRYRKLVRNIPQSRWLCRECRGRGCSRCGNTGKMYSLSVEEIIAGPIIASTNGRSDKFHAAGREDVDARMVGEGRPFVVEILAPRKRSLDLEALKNQINQSSSGQVEISDLSYSAKENIRDMKAGGQAAKIYKAIIEFSSPFPSDRLPELERALWRATIRQQTPIRVLHRRADRMREKHIYMLKLTALTPTRAEMLVQCQGGLYVKELINGDEGRTTPSISELAGLPARCVELDVLDVRTEGFE